MKSTEALMPKRVFFEMSETAPNALFDPVEDEAVELLALSTIPEGVEPSTASQNVYHMSRGIKQLDTYR